MGIDTSGWESIELECQIVEGNRNEVWRGTIDGAPVAVRQSRRDTRSLDWELDLIDYLASCGFTVPTAINSDDGRRHIDGVVVQQWLPGKPPVSKSDWQLVADTLQRLHRITANYRQRPGCAAVAALTPTTVSADADMSALPVDVADDVLSIFATVAEMPLSVVHGDPMAGNIRINDGGDVGLLDFDESRVDVAWHDLSNLGIQILDDTSHAQAERLSDAWEAVNGWIVEPDYARRRLDALRASFAD